MKRTILYGALACGLIGLGAYYYTNGKQELNTVKKNNAVFRTLDSLKAQQMEAVWKVQDYNAEFLTCRQSCTPISEKREANYRRIDSIDASIAHIESGPEVLSYHRAVAKAMDKITLGSFFAGASLAATLMLYTRRKK